MEAMSEQERFEHGNIPRDFELRRRITDDLTEVAIIGCLLIGDENDEE